MVPELNELDQVLGSFCNGDEICLADKGRQDAEGMLRLYYCETGEDVGQATIDVGFFCEEKFVVPDDACGVVSGEMLISYGYGYTTCDGPFFEKYSNAQKIVFQYEVKPFEISDITVQDEKFDIDHPIFPISLKTELRRDQSNKCDIPSDDFEWNATASEYTFSSLNSGSNSIDFEKPFVLKDSERSFKVSAEYIGSKCVDPRKADDLELKLIQFDCWAHDTEEVEDDFTLIYTTQEAQDRASDDSKVVYWTPITIKTSWEKEMKLQFTPNGGEKLFFVKEVPNNDSDLKNEAITFSADERLFYIGSKDVSEDVTLATYNVSMELDENKWKTALENKEINLLPVDLDILHPATGELSDSKEDVDDGGYVSIKREVDGVDVAPVTELKIHKLDGLSGAKFRLKFNAGGAYKIYSNSSRTTAVSQSTEFSASDDVTLYFQGEEKSSSRGGEEVTMQIDPKGDGNWVDGDSVKFTVVQSEFEIGHRVFIPYNWVDIPFHPAHTDDVAKGDDRDYDPTFSNDSAYRAEQVAIINPYRDLASDWLRSKENTAGLTIHYDEEDVINFSEGAKHSEDVPNPPSYISPGAEPDASGLADVSDVDVFNLPAISNEDQSFVKVKGSAAEPIIFAAQPIDWDYVVGIDKSDPLNPKVLFSGKHDGFPAYEIYVNARHPLFDVTTIWQFKPPLDKSVLDLFGGATEPTGDLTIPIN